MQNKSSFRMDFSSKKQDGTLAVLAIGNSFSASAFRHLHGLVSSIYGHVIRFDCANIPGCSLERHCEENERAERDRAYVPPYCYANGKRTLREFLEADRWDVVTFNQASRLSCQYDTWHPHFDRLVALVRKYAPQAKIMLQQTWAYRADSSCFDPANPSWWRMDQAEMFCRIEAVYARISAETGFRVIPAGKAIQLARETQPEKFRSPDPAVVRRLRYPDLPDQRGSFIKGYSWVEDGKGGHVLDADFNHLNARGEYLQACVWFAGLFGRNPDETAAYEPQGISAGDARFLREVARKVVSGYQLQFDSLYLFA
ncbi:hypothetical protein OpiT1DRAFT_00125 [Opitutaceae bacterium TAV1]|nr:hypothetical protein OpiT1DRAFT_00125 [Opitutaceae bacterium TAV1]